jgi:two-component system, NtrC family, sensor kinase
VYHGLRGKDKRFRADVHTDYDPGIGKVLLVPQEIGRVLMNLLTNAFYATSERLKSAGETYKPQVSLQTKKTGDHVQIRISDNGNGIAQNLVDKIFQPFFTTKPSGEGTGLGLSLSYDIVTKGHGGEILVETKEGEGATFVIVLPAGEEREEA